MPEGLIDALYGELETKLSKNDEATFSAMAMAREIQKNMAVSNLEESMSNVSLASSVPIREVERGNLNTYLHLVDKLMSTHVGKDEIFLERLMDLVAALSALSGESAAKEIAERAIMYSRAIIERVRKRAVDFISVLVTYCLEHFGENSSDLVSRMEDAIIVRLKDRSKTVRAGAIEASTRLFENQHYSEQLLHSIFWNLSHDPSAACRGSAVTTLPVNETTLGHIVERIRDNEKNVRVAVLQALTAKQDSASFMSSDIFAEIIRGGFSERCIATKEAMRSLVLCNWIEYVEYDMVKLLRQIDVVANEDECGMLVTEIIECLETCAEIPEHLRVANLQALRTSFLRQKKKFVQSIEMEQNVEPEETFLFHLAHLKGIESQDMLSPENYNIYSSLDTAKLCDRISKISGALQEAIKDQDDNRQEECAFQCFQLMQIVGLTSLSEEGSKRHFINFIEKFLSSKNTADELVDRSTSIFFTAHGKETNCFGIICSVLHHLFREPEPWSTTRCLHILAPTLESAPTHAIDNDLIVDFSSTIAISITNDDTAVRELAVSCLGKLGYFSPPRKVHEDIQQILSEVAMNEKEKLAVRSQALLSLCDLAILRQEDLLLQQCSDDWHSFVHVLEVLIWSSNSSVVALVGEICAKLLLDGRTNERKLLASLLALYFDPCQMEDRDAEYSEARAMGNPFRLQQLLSIFFPVFALKSDSNLIALIESLHLAFEYSFGARRSKPLKHGAKFPMLKMAEYITAISDDNSFELGCSCTAALTICTQVVRFLLSTPSLSGVQTRASCNFVLQQIMKTELESNVSVRELILLLEDLQMIVSDETAVDSLTQATERLADFESSRGDDSMLTSDANSSNFEETVTSAGVLADSTNAADASNSKPYKK